MTKIKKQKRENNNDEQIVNTYSYGINRPIRQNIYYMTYQGKVARSLIDEQREKEKKNKKKEQDNEGREL